MRSIKRNLLYNLIYQVLIILLPLITSPYTSRILGAEGIGAYSYTSSIASYFILFGMLGIKNYGSRSVAKVRDDEKALCETFWSIYGLQLITTATMFIFYFLFCIFFMRNNKILAFLQTIYVFSSLLDISWFFRGIEEFKLILTRTIPLRVLNVIMIFCFIKNRNDLWIYTLIVSGELVINNLAAWAYLKAHIKFTRPNKKQILKHLKPNLTLFITVLAVSLYKVMDKIMLGRLASFREVGFYENTEKVINIPLGLITVLEAVMLPRMSNLVAKDSKQEEKRLLEQSLLFIMLLGSGMTFGIAGVAPTFTPLYFGEEFYACIKMIIIISPSILFISWGNVILTQFLIPNNYDRQFAISVSIGAVFNLILNVALVPHYGALGTAIGTLATEILVCLVQTYFAKKYIEVMEYLKNSLVFLVFGILMFGFVRIIGSAPYPSVIVLGSQIILGGSLYILISFIYLKHKNNPIILNIVDFLRIKKYANNSYMKEKN